MDRVSFRIQGTRQSRPKSLRKLSLGVAVGQLNVRKDKNLNGGTKQKSFHMQKGREAK